jgi:hypothetical protein
MEQFLLIAAFVLFVIGGIWLWVSGHRPHTLIAAGLACWVLTTFVSGLG